MRTETSTTWANPDGTMTSEVHSGQIRYRDDDGGLRPVDLELRELPDGTVAPLGHAHGLRLSGATSGATADAVVATAGKGREVARGWPGRLPKPELAGTKAIYRAVAPNVDMVVEARRSGYEQTFVIHQRPAEAMSWDLPLRTKGLTPRPEADGSISFVDAKKTVVSRIPAAIAWDAAVDPKSGNHVNVSPVQLTVKQHSPGRATLTVRPDAAWLADPARVFPVTVDPTYASGSATTSMDTYVSSQYSTTAYNTSTELRVGTYNGGGDRYRSFLNFPLTAITGKKIMSASLSLYAFHSWSCTATGVSAYTSGTAYSTTTWANQPAGGTFAGSASFAKGYSSSCPGGRVSIPVTSTVQGWSASSGTKTLRLSAAETENSGWKKFYSLESSQDPYITFTYDRKPNAASTPTLSPVASYAPPGASTSSLFTSDTTPAFTSKATDPDANTVRITFEAHSSTTASSSTLKATCQTAYVASGANATCSSTTALADNATYYVRAAVYDGYLWNGTWSPWTTFKVAAATPAAPAITCPQADGSWTETPPPSNVTCTVTAPGTGTSAPGYLRVAVDGATETQVKITPFSDPNIAKTTVTVPNTAGSHKVTARAESPSGKLSTTAVYQFGYGTAGLLAPKVNPRTTTTGAVRIEATGPPKGASTVPTAKVRWRASGSGQDAASGWNDATSAPLTVVDNGTAGVAVTGSWNAAAETRDAAAGQDLNARVPVLLDVQVCLTYTSGTQCTWSAQQAQVLRVPHAFGSGFPEAAAGPGQVALWTGEFAMGAADVSVPGYTGQLSLSRTHSTFAGEANPAGKVFGPGWTAALDGPESGAAAMQVVDSTRIDGTIALLDGGTALVYTTPTGLRRTTAELPTGVYEPADEDSALEAAEVRVSGSGSTTTLTFTEDDGTVTVFTTTAAPAAGSNALFAPASVTEAGATGKTTYSRDSAGRIARIVAPTPQGVTCSPSSDPTVPLLTAGCRSLRLEYATATTATPASNGDVNGQVKAVWLDIYDPDKPGGPGGNSIKVAAYTYESSARLVTVTDPRSGLTTGYGYDGTSNRLASVTPPGQDAYTLTYTASPDFKLNAVTRARPAGDPAGGTAILTSLIYGVPTTGAGLPALADTTVAAWGQAKAPTYGAAVFGPDHPAPAVPGEADWAHADLHYTDERGYTVNTARYGAGAWQLTATDYNDKGNVIRELDAEAIATITAGELPPGATADQLATSTVYNADITAADGTVLTPAGTLVVDSYGPARWATLTDGTRAWARPRTHNQFDQNAPHNGINPDTNLPYRQLTTETVTAYDPGTGADIDTAAATTSEFDPIEPGDESGWKLGAATSKTTLLTGGTTITHTTRYDAEGKVIETRQPRSTGADAGTRKTYHYTAAPHPTHSQCGGKPQWAGLDCLITYGGTPNAGPALLSSHTSSYSALLAPTVETESAGSITRTTTTTYYASGSVNTSKTTVAGVAGSEPLPATKTVYASTTGLPTEVIRLDGSGTETSDRQTTGYDSWGRVTSYSSAPGETTTTGYDLAGRVRTVTDPTGTTTYTYDGTDANGKIEHRGLLTRLDVSNTGGSAVTFTGGYNPAGNLITQTLPGGITQITDYDTAGEPVGRTYRGQVTTIAEDGAVTVDPNGSWLSWSQDNDIDGRVRREWTPAGAAFTDGPASTNPPETGAVDAGDALGYDREYRYDRAGRLITVLDRTATITGTAPEPGDPASTDTPCHVRQYGFDTNGNRTSLTRRGANPDGSCATTGGTTTTWAYDNADRLTTAGDTTGAYTYDGLGRITTLPAADTPKGTSAGNLTIGYHDTDAVRSLTQGGTTTTYSLDVAGRRSEAATGPTGQPITTRLVRHYTDTSDNPDWVELTENGQTAITRYVAALGNDLSATITAGLVTLPLTNLHGDAVTTVSVPPSGAATSIGSWSDYDEYGNPRDPAAAHAVGGAIGYGWLGAKQRATDHTGLLLMGARLYNPVTGQFTSPDPVYGGNDTAYAYPTDPINKYDLDGQWGWFKKAWNGVKRAASAVGRGLATAGRWAWRNKWNIASVAASFIPGVGAATWAYRAYRVVRWARAAQASNGINVSVRASRATSWLAGRMWTRGRGAVMGHAKNGARMRTNGNYTWRGPAKKGKYGYSSNLTYGTKGHHNYFNFHINHRKYW